MQPWLPPPCPGFESSPLPSTPARPHAPALPKAQIGRHPFTPLIPVFRAPNSSNLQLPRVATLLALSHSPEPGSATRALRDRLEASWSRGPGVGCALTSPRFGAREAPGLGEGRLGALRRPRLRRRGRGGAPGWPFIGSYAWPRPQGERPEAGTCVPNRPGRGSRDSEVSAIRKLLTNTRRPARPSRPHDRVSAALSRSPPLLGLDAPPRLLRQRRPTCSPADPGLSLAGASPGERALLPPLFFPLLFFLLCVFSRRLLVYRPGGPDF